MNPSVSIDDSHCAGTSAVGALEAALLTLPALPDSEVALDLLQQIQQKCRSRHAEISASCRKRKRLQEEETGVKAQVEYPPHAGSATGDSAGGYFVEDAAGLIGSVSDIHWNGRTWCDAVAAETLRLSATYTAHPGVTSMYSPDARLHRYSVEQVASYQTVFEVTGEDSLDAARRLISESSSDLRPLVLNMANASWVGGGFLRGSAGQEEELCRRSTLFCELAAIRPWPYPMAAHGTILTTDVIVFRGSGPLYPVLKEPFNVTIATAAAPQRPDVSTDEGAAAYAELMTAKIDALLHACHAAAHRELVLSAWGCGAFRNPPSEVARLFREAFGRPPFATAFKRVVFAVLDRWGTEQNRPEFERAFADLASSSSLT